MALERIKTLNSELTADPLGRGYSTMSDQEAADDLNTEYRDVEVTSVKSAVVLEATVLSDYTALGADDKALYQAMLAMGELDPSGANTRNIFQGLFSGTTTLANLNALDTRTVSRAVELLGEGITVTAALANAARSYVP